MTETRAVLKVVTRMLPVVLGRALELPSAAPQQPPTKKILSCYVAPRATVSPCTTNLRRGYLILHYKLVLFNHSDDCGGCSEPIEPQHVAPLHSSSSMQPLVPDTCHCREVRQESHSSSSTLQCTHLHRRALYE